MRAKGTATLSSSIQQILGPRLSTPQRYTASRGCGVGVLRVPGVRGVSGSPRKRLRGELEENAEPFVFEAIADEQIADGGRARGPLPLGACLGQG